MPFHQIPSLYNQTKRNRFVLPSPCVGQQAGRQASADPHHTAGIAQPNRPRCKWT